MTSQEAINTLQNYLINYPSFDNPKLRRALTQGIEALEEKRDREEVQQP